MTAKPQGGVKTLIPALALAGLTCLAGCVGQDPQNQMVSLQLLHELMQAQDSANHPTIFGGPSMTQCRTIGNNTQCSTF